MTKETYLYVAGRKKPKLDVLFCKLDQKCYTDRQKIRLLCIKFFVLLTFFKQTPNLFNIGNRRRRCSSWLSFLRNNLGLDFFFHYFLYVNIPCSNVYMMEIEKWMKKILYIFSASLSPSYFLCSSIFVKYVIECNLVFSRFCYGWLTGFVKT